MSEIPNKFVWYDLMTSDHKAAESFYRKVIGWGAIALTRFFPWDQRWSAD